MRKKKKPIIFKFPLKSDRKLYFLKIKPEFFSLFLSVIATIVSFFSFYFSFFYKKSELRLSVISQLIDKKDTTIRCNVFFHNMGNQSVTLLNHDIELYGDIYDKNRNIKYVYSKNINIKDMRMKFNSHVMHSGEQYCSEMTCSFAPQSNNHSDTLKYNLLIEYIDNNGLYQTKAYPLGWLKLDSSLVYSIYSKRNFSVVLE